MEDSLWRIRRASSLLRHQIVDEKRKLNKLITKGLIDMSYRYRIKSIFDSLTTQAEIVLSGELLEGETPDDIHTSYIRLENRRIELQVARALILVEYKPGTSENQKSCFL